MRVISAAEVLTIWEWGQPQTPDRRAVSLLTAAYPDDSAQAIAELPIGRRDARLMALRESLFGSYLDCLANCPACAESVELGINLTDIRIEPPLLSDDQLLDGSEKASPLSLNVAGYELKFRLPNSQDLAAVTDNGADAGARQRLLQRCIVTVSRQGQRQSAETLPDEVIKALVERMAEIDPQADVRLSLTCPQCAHRWMATFDIASYLWTEIESWARRILLDVHTLASAYGWSEADILALSPTRRRLYLEMAGTR